MFRCITNLRGLAVHIDSFSNIDVDEWKEINSIVSCVFLTTSESIKQRFEKAFGIQSVVLLESFEMLFSPNKNTHIRVLKQLGIQNTELAYVSCDFMFLENANSFLSGTIWISQKVTYEQASKAPDIILDSVKQLKESLEAEIDGFYGELQVFPRRSSFSSANIIPVRYEVDNETVAMYVLGRYYSSTNYIGSFHPYSIALSHNKIPGKKYTGVFDDTFMGLYGNVIFLLMRSYDIDSVCSVPVKPGKSARFDKILSEISLKCSIENIGNNFRCNRNYPDQKSLLSEERRKNVEGVFTYSGRLDGKTIVLIDDISSTGSTICECVRELKRKGAKKIIIVLLAINQIGSGAYWSSNTPAVLCPTCKSKMMLQLSKDRVFFFSCVECFRTKKLNSTLSFDNGWNQLCEAENAKFNYLMNKDRIETLNTAIKEDGTIRLERIIKCPHCNSENVIDLAEISQVSNYERQMGLETLLEYDDVCVCETCGRSFHIEGYVSLYPQNVVNNEIINIDTIDEDL